MPTPERIDELRAICEQGGETALSEECSRILDAYIHRQIERADLELVFRYSHRLSRYEPVDEPVVMKVMEGPKQHRWIALAPPDAPFRIAVLANSEADAADRYRGKLRALRRFASPGLT